MNYNIHISKELQLAYVILSSILCFINLTIALLCLRGAIKNKCNIWSPHFELLFYLLGNILSTISFIIRWEARIDTSTAPLYYMGQAFTISSLIVLNNKLQYMMKQSATQYVPFWVCINLKHSKKAYILQFIFIALPQVSITLLQILVQLVITDKKIVQYFDFATDALFTVLILYCCVIICISATQYINLNHDQSTFAKLSLTISFLTVVDAILSQGIYFIIAIYTCFNIGFEDALWAIIVFVKDWGSMILYATEQVLIFVILRYIFVMMKELRTATEMDYLLDSY